MKRFTIETIPGEEVGSGCLIDDGSGQIEIRGEQFRLKSLGDGDAHRFLPHVQPQDFCEVRKAGEPVIGLGEK